jgi:hypothetical protein
MNIQEINIIFKVLIQFFTFWGLFLQILYYCGFIKKYEYSLFFILLVISFGGFFITYINPKKIFIPYFNITIQNNYLKFSDLILHQIPLLIFLLIAKFKTKDNLILAFTTIILYLLIFNPYYIYKKKCLK